MSAVRIGSNIASLAAQRRLGENTRELTSVFERLSSGQRINRASDDAAGLSISETLKSDKRIANQGVRNFNDGISLLNIADSTIESLTGIVVRLKELSEQAANAVYGSKQRDAMDAEAQALSKEYLRIAQGTKYNGKYLFDGSTDSLRLQGGVGIDGSIGSSLGGAIGTGSFALAVSAALSPTATGLATGDFNNDGIKDLFYRNGFNAHISLAQEGGTLGPANIVATGTAVTLVTDTNGDGNVDLIRSASTLLGNGDGTFTNLAVNGTGGLTIRGVADLNNDGIQDLITEEDISIFGIRLGSTTGTYTKVETYDTGSEINNFLEGDFNGDGKTDLAANFQDSTDIRVFLGDGSGKISSYVTYELGEHTSIPFSVYRDSVSGKDKIAAFSTTAGSNNLYAIGMNSSGALVSSQTTFLGGATDYSFGVTADFNGDGREDLLLNGPSSIVFTQGATGTLNRGVTVSTGGATVLGTEDFNKDGVPDLFSVTSSSYRFFHGLSTSGLHSLLEFDLSTISGARSAMKTFDNKLQSLLNQRGQIGAFEARLNVGINTLTSSSENYAAAEGRIRNADIADESSKLVRLNILQEAASSVLAQANKQPTIALKLLQD